MISKESIAKDLYTIYCIEVGGKAFNGLPLPEWEEFYNDSEKQIQVRAWLAIGQKVLDMI